MTTSYGVAPAPTICLAAAVATRLWAELGRTICKETLTSTGAGQRVRSTHPDDLRGGPGPDFLYGGAGRDRVIGGDGNDTFAGDPLRGELAVGPSRAPRVLPRAADRLVGGEGIDFALYANRMRGESAPRLSVSFDGKANDGRCTERDNVAKSVELAAAFTSTQLNVIEGGGITVGNHARIYRFSARGTKGADTGIFDGHEFTIPAPRDNGPLDLSLPPADVTICPSVSPRAPLSSATPIRRLRGRARGRFRTVGRNSAATIRGTDWTITDRCDGTLTTVRRGTVKVRDFGLHKTVVLHAGEKYLARAR